MTSYSYNGYLFRLLAEKFVQAPRLYDQNCESPNLWPQYKNQNGREATEAVISVRVPDVDVDLHGLLGVDVDVLHECARFVLADRDGGEAEGAVALENMLIA